MAELKPWADFSSLCSFFFLQLLGLKCSEDLGVFQRVSDREDKKKRTVSLGDGDICWWGESKLTELRRTIS